MRTRMQPIGDLWNRFPRIVRDLARQCGKEARVEMVGASTGLDRTILEAIKGPLTHLIRNAVGHGIETSRDRLSLGKPPEGVIQLRAFQDGGDVVVEVRDDGVGISPSLVRRTALERGLIAPDQSARMDDGDVLGLVFAPGFSTAPAVTNVSGRGVGMDVVRNDVEKVGGTVDLRSEPGRGTTVRLKIPLTLAILPDPHAISRSTPHPIPRVDRLELVRRHEQAAVPEVD